MPARLKSRIVRSLPWSLAESVVNGCVGFSQALLLIALLKPEELGTAAIALSTVFLVEVIVQLGLGEAIIGARSSHTVVTDTAFTGVMAGASAGAAFCLIIAFPMAANYGNPELRSLIMVAALILPVNALVVIPTALLTRKLRAAQMTLRFTLTKVATVAVTVGLAWWGYGAWSLVLGTLAGSMVTAAVLLPLTKRIPRFRFDPTAFRSLVRYGALMSMERLCWVAMARVFALIVGYYHGAATLGYFQFALRLIEETASVLQAFAIRFGLSIFASIRRAGRQVTEAFNKASHLVSIIGPPVFVGLALVLPDTVGVIFHERWRPGIVVGQIAAIAWAFAFPRVLVGPLLRADGYTEPLLLYAVAASLLTIVGALATSEAPLWLLAVSWVARQLIGFPWAIAMLRKHYGLSITTQLRGLAVPAFANFCMAATVIVAGRLLPAPGTWSRLAGEVTFGGAVYIFVIGVCDGKARALIRELKEAWG